MYISQISVSNFRLLKNSKLDFGDNLCLMIGRNNSGKTSFLVLFEKFYNNLSFDFNDLPISLRNKVEHIDVDTDISDITIRLIISIRYEENDNLCNLSEFIMDLDPQCKDINILFECSINKEKLLEALRDNPQISATKYIRKYLALYFEKRIFVFESEDDIKTPNRHRLIKKELDDVKKLIDFEIIHAKRSVSSSEERTRNKVLSGLTTKFYNTINESTPNKFEEINNIIDVMDEKLNKEYAVFFDNFVRNARDFLSLDGLKIISNLKAKEIISDSSEVIYGDEQCHLPEYLNGLGYMNILYLLLEIEIKKTYFLGNNKDIKLLYIEEPEAHTHPQLQYIFARKIEDLLTGIAGLQAIITTHSPYIVANHPFENIRYMLIGKDRDGCDNIEIISFYKELSKRYQDEIDEFQFLKQYLSVEATGLFFASKAIFIEGISENMLLPLFISQFDNYQLEKEKRKIEVKVKTKSEYIPLSSQNISILQVGANAKAFRHFLELLQIRTLIITDIDTIKQAKTKKEKIIYIACKVSDSPISTSNETLKFYFNAPSFAQHDLYSTWFANLLTNSLSSISSIVGVYYQQDEKGYHARSFEDAFIHINGEEVNSYLANIGGLKNKDVYDVKADVYQTTKRILDKKSDFAASLLFLSHTKNMKWNIPSYIWEGLKWIQKI